MPVMDEFREERAALKHGTPKQKLQYFLDYYKWPTIVAICLIIAVSSYIYHLVTQKDNALFAVFLNCYTAPEYEEPFLQDYAETAGIDQKKYQVLVDTSLTLTEDGMDQNSYMAIQKMMVYLAAKEIDVLAADVPNFFRYAYNDTLFDLRDVLSPEQLKAYEPYFFYIDGKVLERQRDLQESMEEYSITYPDPTKPEEMEDPIPVAIYLDNAVRLEGHYEFSQKPAVLGIVVNTTRKDAALQFLDYLFSE